MRRRWRPCFNPRCTRTVGGRYLSCLPCWRRVPESLRLAVECTAQEMRRLAPRAESGDLVAREGLVAAQRWWREAVTAAQHCLAG